MPGPPDRVRRDHPRARLGTAERALPVAGAQGALFAMVAWVVGMTLAVSTENPLSRRGRSSALRSFATGTTHRMTGADLSGLNAGYVAQMLEAYLDAPASVSAGVARPLRARSGRVHRVAARARGPAQRDGDERRCRCPRRTAPMHRRRRAACRRAAPPAAEPVAGRSRAAPPARRRGRRGRRARPAPPNGSPESTRTSSAASPRRWRSSRPTGCTGTLPRGSTRSAPSRWATRRSTSRASSRR